MEDLHLVEYRVRPVTRYVVTRYHEGKRCGGSDEKGEFGNEADAFEVATALCKVEHQQLGWPIDDPRIIYPKREEPVAQVAR